MAKRQRGNGQGTVRKLPSGRFQALVVLGTDRAGKRKERSAGTFATKREAEQALASLITDQRRGLLPERSRLSLAEYTERVLARRHDIDGQTLETYRRELGYALEVLGEQALQDLHPHHLKDALVKLSQREMHKGRGRGKRMSARTLGKVVTHLKTVFREAVQDRLIYANPTEGLRKPRGLTTASERVGRVLNLAQLERFQAVGQALWEAGSCRLWPALFCAASLGLRRGEVMGLRVQDLDWEGDKLLIRQAQSLFQSKPRLGRTKTEGSTRDVYLPSSLKVVLRSHIQQRERDRIQSGALWSGGEALFSTELGGYTHTDNLARSLCCVVAWSDPQTLERKLRSLPKGVDVGAVQRLRTVILTGEVLPTLSPHDLRHTYATVALMRGVPVEVVSKVLGHATVSITLDTYRHVLDTERRKGAIDLFGPPSALLTGPEEGSERALLN